MSLIHALTMPKWGLSMKEGKIVGWLVDEGTVLTPGVELLEIETDKILNSLEAPVPGILRRKVARIDDLVPVAGLLAVIADASVSESQIDVFIDDFQTRVSENGAAEASIPLPEVAVARDQHLQYLKRGDGKEVVVLIHGFGGDLNSWLFNHEDLAGTRTVYALDLPGHGGSSKRVGSGTLLEFVQSLEGFMDTLGLFRTHLVGHSMGGAVALGFSLAHPERVVSLALISSVALGREIDGAFIEGLTAASRRKEIKPHLDKLFADSRLVGRQMVEDVLKYKRLDGVDLALRTVAAQFFPGGQQAVVLRDDLSQLSMPVMAIWGADDQILPSFHARDLPKNVRTEILPGCGHMVQMEAATTFNRLLQSFWEASSPVDPTP